MAIKSYLMGPGTLTLNPGAGALEISAQIRNARVEWTETVTPGEALPVLSGDELPGDDTTTYAAALAGTLIQDLDAAGIVAYSWAHKGEATPFEFVPSTAEARAVSGSVILVPLTVGGDVKARNTADFTWRCDGDPALGAAV